MPSHCKRRHFRVCSTAWRGSPAPWATPRSARAVPVFKHHDLESLAPFTGEQWPPDWERLADGDGLVEVAAILRGGSVVASSDEFFGAPHHLLLPGDPQGMWDGWETRRRRGPGRGRGRRTRGGGGTGANSSTPPVAARSSFRCLSLSTRSAMIYGWRLRCRSRFRRESLA